ncbi:RNA polymerase sigma factor [Mucilaginibacter paludis]|uniref:RNA polymerase, sigma-24 subunit, ECF subfamily n=1 Tax=Mucilaginibacter paludis DSM 18603 TaxID=714943 RepID=H1YAR5_9SPHI|nr:sigma-70 family RNA polymerase sigma factor [Mucilaginibacter paludis]EHQ29524.1 RNA polymerase, sigma-24 subunit, ECF subfamily [Mucilaginibacter paludis DSM 18603]
MKQAPDHNLIELIKNDNHLAFTALVDRYWEELYRHIWMKIKNQDDAKDIVQDIFLGLWKNRATIVIAQNGQIAPYLFSAAKYAVINYFIRPGITVADEAVLSLAINSPSGIKTDDPFLLKELQQLVDTEVSSLPERLQVPYRLSREQELTIKEIAQKLSLSEQTVKNNISSALQKIRFRLGEYNSDHSAYLVVALAAMLHYK